MLRAAVVLSIALSSFLSACSSLNSYRTQTAGVPYFLPTTLVQYIVDIDDPNASDVLTMDVADKSRPRYLAYAPSPSAEENLCIDRTETGLLKKVYFGAHDRTSDILLNVVEILARAGPPHDDPDDGGLAAAQAQCSGVKVSEWMDPFDKEAVRKFEAELCGKLTIDIPDLVDLNEGYRECPTDAVCFPTKTDMNGYLRWPDGRIAYTFEKQTVVSRRDIGWFRIRSAFFNRRITQLDFKDGVLTTVRVKKDSELLGLSEFPLKAVERILAVPGNAIGLVFATYQEKVLYLTRRKELKEAAEASAPEPQPPPGNGLNIDVTTTVCDAGTQP